jgi:hypothetical protein
MARAWHPAWPGFNSHGSLLLPLPDIAFSELPSALAFDGLEFERKREFHVTVLDRETGRRLRTHEARNRVRPTARELFEGEDWAWHPTGNKWLLREQRDEGIVHSIIELLDLPGLVRFRHNLGWAHGERLADPPAHVTLYVAGNDIGIGLASKEEFQRLRLRRL